MIAFKNMYKTTFIIDWGTFISKIMPFGFKNAPPTGSLVISTIILIL